MTIAVAYRPDAFAGAALSHAIERAETDGSRLVVVNVGKNERFDEDPSFVHGHALDDLQRRLAGADLREATVRQPLGSDIVTQVLNVVTEEQADLLVVGLRPRSPVGKILLGSVAQRLLLDSPVPVLAVKSE